MFALDKKGSIIYANKQGAKVIESRFWIDYRGSRKWINNVYDLIHDTSKNVLDDLLDPNHIDPKDQERRIGILQNITQDDEEEEKQLDVSSLVIQDKLIYFKAEVLNADWNSGNAIIQNKKISVILVCSSLMGQLIKNKFLTSKSSLMQSNMENLLSEFETMYDHHTERQVISHSTWTSTLCSTSKIVADFQNLVLLFKFASNDVEK